MKRKCFILLGVLFVIFANGSAQVKQYAVEVSAEVRSSPPQLYFSWPKDPYAKEYIIFRKLKNEKEWGPVFASLEGSESSFTDSQVQPGQAFEYGFYKTSSHQRQIIQVENQKSLKFHIRDSWSDGICCNHGFGKYEIKGNNGVYTNGGVFGKEETKIFTVYGGSGGVTDDIVIDIQLDVFAGETTWTLTDIESNEVIASGGPYEGAKYGHVFAGIEYPAIEQRGTLVLVIEQSISINLPVEVNRLINDMICDGWRVRPMVVNRRDKVLDIKNSIIDLKNQYPDLEAVFLLGHVPVPYSGNVMSAHTDHRGAYPADLYYGELDGEWTDQTVYNKSAIRMANFNSPGDGKFDQTYLPSDVDLQVGRVDLNNLPVFHEGEIELTRRYLKKNHDYRNGKIQIARRGLVRNNLGEMLGMAVGAIGLRNFASLFGSSNVIEGEYFSTMVNASYSWSQGCGGGSYTSCGGIGSSSNFASKMVRSTFTMLYGSYFGDWDNKDNFLRAPLASEPSMLAAVWAGAPAWHIHHMALGETLGYVTRLSQNNSTLYAPSDRVRQIHVALMGDPSLRLHVVKPPSNLIAGSSGHTIHLDWLPSEDDIVGYHVYRADSLMGKFIRLNSSIITQTEYNDYVGDNEAYTYMVRAVKLETSGGGSYYNLSQGILDSATSSISLIEHEVKTSIDCFPNPMEESMEISVFIPKNTFTNIDLLDLHGKIIKKVYSGKLSHGTTSFKLNKSDQTGNALAAGIYVVRLMTQYNKPVLKRIQIIR